MHRARPYEAPLSFEGRTRRPLSRSRSPRGFGRRSFDGDDVLASPPGLRAPPPPSFGGRLRSASPNIPMHKFEEEENNTTQQASYLPVMKSFKQFVIDLEEGADPQKSVQRYSEYKKTFMLDYADRYFSANRELPLFVDLYSPEVLARYHEQRCAAVRRRAENFVNLLQSGQLDGLNLSVKGIAGDDEDITMLSAEGAAVQVTCESRRPVVLPTTSTPSPVPPLLLSSPHFPVDPNSCCLLLKGIPSVVSRQDVLDHLVGINVAGLVDVAVTINLPPSPSASDAVGVPAPEVSRDMWLTFESETACHQAERQMDRTTVRETFMLRPVVMAASRKVTVKVIPSAALSPLRIQRDIDQSARLIKILDGVCGVLFPGNESGSHPLVAQEGAELRYEAFQQMDLQVLYLRYVHCCCYYSAKVCFNHRDLIDKCDFMILRPSAPETDEERRYFDSLAAEDTTSQNSWLRSLDSRMSALAISAQAPSPRAVEDNHPEVERLWQELCVSQTLKVNAEKWRCGICKKLFKGAEFVHKHLKNKHGDKFLEVKKEVSAPEMQKNFLADPKRTLMVPSPVTSSKAGRSTGIEGSVYGPHRRRQVSATGEFRHHHMGYRDLDAPTAEVSLVGDVRRAISYSDL